MAAGVVWLLLPALAFGAETRAESSARAYADAEVARAAVGGNLPDYGLPPEELRKADRLAAVERWSHFGGEAWGIAQLALLLWTGAAAWMRDRAVRVSRRWWVQGYGFAGMLLGAVFVLDLPLRVGLHVVSRRYGLSIEGWGAWWLDRLKGLALEWVVGGALLLLLFWTIRRAPRAWWLLLWACMAPVTVFGVFAMPYVEPLFDHYEPLSRTEPALVERLEAVVRKGGMNIPPERMFLMRASAKVTTINADVEGFGGSKRVVVWDNAVRKLTPDQILFVFGHEAGHYVLGHIARGLLLSFVGSLGLFWVGFSAVRWLLGQFGGRWRVRSQEDWGAAVVLLLMMAVVGAVAEPVAAAISRGQEHAADVYGQEAIHGLVRDPQTVAREAFDVLGATSLEEPNPPGWYVLWTYDHPATGWRAAFARAYDPWAEGMRPRYFAPRDFTQGD